jgi:aminomethyltransferase
MLFEAEEGGEPVGEVTSGAFGPTIAAPMAMGYVPSELSKPGTRLYGEVRGKRMPVRVCDLPFTPATFKR